MEEIQSSEHPFKCLLEPALFYQWFHSSIQGSSKLKAFFLKQTKYCQLPGSILFFYYFLFDLWGISKQQQIKFYYLLYNKLGTGALLVTDPLPRCKHTFRNPLKASL